MSKPSTNALGPSFDIDTPLGSMRASLNAAGELVSTCFAAEELAELPKRHSLPGAIVALAEQVAEFARGERTSFALPQASPRTLGTPFQQRVWAQSEHIAPGTTCTYSQLAAAIGAPSSCRAVGTALGKNPLMLIVPCHRVVGASGSLTGYAGGLAAKGLLLKAEQEIFGPANVKRT